MADEQQANVLSAAFPAPPPFYKHFTPDNIKRVHDDDTAARHEARPSQASTADNSGDAAEEAFKNAPSQFFLDDLPPPPPELRYLVPPKPPSTGIYRSFGDRYNINEALPTLRAQGVEQLFPTPPTSPLLNGSNENTFDRQSELTKLARSLLLSFLEIAGTLSVNVEDYAAKLEDLRVLFVNAHHLINEYRPHQARETLIEVMEAEVGRKRGEVEGVRRMRGRIEEMFGEMVSEGGGGGGGGEGGGDSRGEAIEERKRRAETRRVWTALDAIEI